MRILADRFPAARIGGVQLRTTTNLATVYRTVKSLNRHAGPVKKSRPIVRALRLRTCLYGGPEEFPALRMTGARTRNR